MTITENSIEIDVIILSYAQTENLKEVTINSIKSLLDSEDALEIKFNVVVMESNKELDSYQYSNSLTIYPEETFGFHRYLNIGIDNTSSPYVCLCNNDLLYHKGWASEILKYMKYIPDLISASPLCSIYHHNVGVHMNTGMWEGYQIGYEISGWCLFVKRSLFDIIGRLDENLIFGGADYDYSNTLAVLNLKHGLITSSIVDHLDKTTISIQSDESRSKLIYKTNYFDHKWNHRLLPRFY